MKVLTAPLTFVTADDLDTADLNALYLYAQDAVEDVGNKRWQDGALVYQFVEAVGTSYTNTANEELVYRFTCPNTCVVKGAFLNANMTAAAEVTVTVQTTGGVTPTGASTPLLSTGTSVISVASTTTTAACADRFVLTAGQEYKFTVVSSGVFNLSRFDLILHIATDRWTPSGTRAQPSFTPTLFTDASAPDATVVAANNTALSTQAGLFASNLVAPTPLLFCKHNLVTGTSANVRTFSLPRFDSSRAQARLMRMYLYSFSDAIGPVVTATLKDSGGSTLLTVTNNMAAVTQTSADSGSQNIALTAATTSISSNTALDYTLTFANSSATNCRKTYALLWVSR